MEKFSFEKLNVYQEAMNLVVSVYKLIGKLPYDEYKALKLQLQRSISSVPSNIAEGCGRMSHKSKIYFIEIAYGSLLESYCQLQIAQKLNYITEDKIESIKPQYFKVSNLLNALKRSYEQNKE